MLLRVSLALLIPLAACGGSGSTPADAAPPADAGPPTVIEVTCPATVPITVTADDNQIAKFTFTPGNSPIPVGGIVKFMMGLQHDVVPDMGGDPGLMVDFMQTKCLQFTKAGTFGFHCMVHTFRGSITVQ